MIIVIEGNLKGKTYPHWVFRPMCQFLNYNYLFLSTVNYYVFAYISNIENTIKINQVTSNMIAT